jgi:hypothetical protein
MELEELKERWQRKTGEPMPPEILLLPLKKICKAVLLVEAGVTVVIPKGATTVEEDIDRFRDESSILEWDRQDMKNGNAYGS